MRGSLGLPTRQVRYVTISSQRRCGLCVNCRRRVVRARSQNGAELLRLLDRRMGSRYKVYPEDAFAMGGVLANLQAAYLSYAPSYYDSSVAQVATRLLSESEGSSMLIGGLAGRFAQELALPKAVITRALCHSLWHGSLVPDMNRLLFFESAGRLVCTKPA